MTQNGEEAVYEMLWDCKYCGQKKNLGLTHRFCPGCGGPQDPAARYFPTDDQKVAVKDHPFVGADLHCPSCNQPMSAAAKNCTNCGSPLQGGRQVALKEAPGAMPPQPVMAQPPPQVQPPKKSNLGLILGIVGGVVGLIVILILVAVFWKREGTFAVAGHAWERDIVVEQYSQNHKSVWCTEVPPGATINSRHQEQNGTTQTPDGETCTTAKKDQGNGTFKEVKTCTPKYKSTPKMEDKCDITVTEWHTERTATAKGVGMAPAPNWPATNMTHPGLCIGCEREGARTEKYTLNFTNTKDSSAASCDVTQQKWSTFADGSKWKGSVGVLTGSLDCDNLQAQ